MCEHLMDILIALSALAIAILFVCLLVTISEWFSERSEETRKNMEIIAEHDAKLEQDEKEKDFYWLMHAYLERYETNVLSRPFNGLIDKRLTELGLMPKGKKK